MSLNARSLLPKIDELVSHIITPGCLYLPDVIAVCESWLDDSVESFELKLNFHYSIFRHDRNRHGGGVLIFAANYLRPKLLDSILSPSFESLAIEGFLGPSKQKLFFSVSHRLTADGLAGIADFHNRLRPKSFKHTFICGDFNVDLLDPVHPLAGGFWDFADGFSLSQLVKDPTRVTDKSSTLLDIFLTSAPDLTYSCESLPPLGSSDHNIILASLSLIRVLPVPCTRRVWLYDKANWEEACALLSALPSSFWPSNDVNEAWSMFYTYFWSVITKCVPQKTVTMRAHPVPWVNGPALRAIAFRDRLFLKAQKSRKAAHWAAYRACRNSTANFLKDVKSKYFADLLHDGSLNPKKLWKNIKAFGKRSSSIPLHIRSGSSFADSPLTIANLFGDFFASCFNKIRPVSFLFNSYNPVTLRTNFTCSPNMVAKLISSMSNHSATGPDGISARMLKGTLEAVSPHLAAIMNISLSTGVFPYDWKHAHVVPLFKDGDPNFVDNFRPISLLPLVSKILERIVHGQLIETLDSNNIISCKQFGFRRKSSTSDALLSFSKFKTDSLEAKNDVCSVFLDLRKAFDTVPHLPLLSKISNCGISDLALQWINSYLSDRTQAVIVGGAVSDTLPVPSGVPQGSVLGPTLFNVYINDLTLIKLSSATSLFLYADDVTVAHSLPPNSSPELFQRDLSAIFKWFTNNFLYVNRKKSVWMLFSSRNAHQIRSDLSFGFDSNNPISRVFSFKLLGVWLSCNSSWALHVSKATAKARRSWGLIGRSFGNAPAPLLRLLFVQLVRPIVEYAACVWNPQQAGLVKSLDGVQSLACRSIRRAPVSHSQQNLRPAPSDLPTLSVRRNYLTLLALFKARSGLSLYVFSTARTLDNRTRSSCPGIVPPFFRLSSSLNSFCGVAPRLWNSLPESLQAHTEFLSFKTNLRLHLSVS